MRTRLRDDRWRGGTTGTGAGGSVGLPERSSVSVLVIAGLALSPSRAVRTG
jgi:hypothetical protein